MVEMRWKKINAKIFFIIGIIICAMALIIGFVIYFLSGLFYTHNLLIKNPHNFEPYSIESVDKMYLLKTKKLNENTGTYATFDIESVNEGKVIYECPDKYRTFDLKSINWDSLNVVVVSGDVGTITYKFAEGQWIK